MLNKNNLLKKEKSPEKQSYGKYLFAGVVIAAIVMIFVTQSENDEVFKNSQSNQQSPHIWSAETDSQFVKDCYNKYKPQVKDDMVKQETMKLFCKCMLEKVKSKYDERDLMQVKNEEIKIWDTECRDRISNSNFFK